MKTKTFIIIAGVVIAAFTVAVVHSQYTTPPIPHKVAVDLEVRWQATGGAIGAVLWSDGTVIVTSLK